MRKKDWEAFNYRLENAKNEGVAAYIQELRDIKTQLDLVGFDTDLEITDVREGLDHGKDYPREKINEILHKLSSRYYDLYYLITEGYDKIKIKK